MSKLLYSLSLFLFVLLFSGCGGGSTSEQVDNSVNMVINTDYIMDSSGIITKVSTDANISIETDLDTNETIATLKSGKAKCTGCTVVP